MSTWLIEPRDPLIVRDGRPIGGTAPISTLPFPYPSTMAGVARTRMGSVGGNFVMHNELDALRAQAVAGPILAELEPEPEGNSESQGVKDWYFPAPRDALLRRLEREAGVVDKHKALRQRLAPQSLQKGEAVDSLADKGLLPVLPAGQFRKEKPLSNAPVFWSWKSLQSWLIAPEPQGEVDIEELGIGALPAETRTHVSMVAGERVSSDGELFSTRGLRFVMGKGNARLSEMRQFALSVRCTESAAGGRELAMRSELAPMGGERRLARFRQAAREWPAVPGEVRAAVKETRRARLVLVTPAIFLAGALPKWSNTDWPEGGPVTARVRAACVPSAEVVSGWDLAKGKPKPTRRVAAAGSVYFVELEGGTDSDVDAWVVNTWLQSVCDAKQDRLDGFGLVVLGAWPKEMNP